MFNRKLRKRVTVLEWEVRELRLVVNDMPNKIERNRRVSELSKIKPMTDVWVCDNVENKPKWIKVKFISVCNDSAIVLDEKEGLTRHAYIEWVSLTKPKEA